MNLNDDETLEELHTGNLRLIQGKKEFRFGIDAVLLSAFAGTKGKLRACDLGSGNGIIPLLMTSQNPGLEFDCIEIQKKAADMAERTMRLNGLNEKIRIHCADIKASPALLGKNRFDIVVSNPPYIEVSGGNTNRTKSLSIARHEILCSLEDIINAASCLLKPHGKFFIIHKPFRIPQIFMLLQKHSLAPKRMQLVFPTAQKEASMVMLESEKCARPYLRTENPLVIYNPDGTYTSQVNRIYGRSTDENEI
ncbi:tRNA1(Val) (adenine(37)-N6)-methyltransferase [Treponema sp.]|uniref:tRNA1(Val) (adenine(37)-N6)-methyltransferase n=1 Tax=Treponema sp. TaxID=166 RepID=UPI003F104EEB